MKKVKLTSFAYRDSHPPETAHLVIDCREMRNPHRLGRLRELNGHDRDVQDYVMSDPEFKPIVGRVLSGRNTAARSPSAASAASTARSPWPSSPARC